MVATQKTTFREKLSFTGNDLTGGIIRMFVRAAFGDVSAVFSLTSVAGAGIIFESDDDITNGDFTVFISATDMNIEAPKEYVYGLEFQDVAGHIEPLLQGAFTVSPWPS
jgi:hypothetical protein